MEAPFRIPSSSFVNDFEVCASRTFEVFDGPEAEFAVTSGHESGSHDDIRQVDA